VNIRHRDRAHHLMSFRSELSGLSLSPIRSDRPDRQLSL
jgi:hypothetical protein